MVNHEKYMKRCLELAQNGLGKTKTNPLVGCVLVYQGEIISEGFHEYFGGPHAEVNALKKEIDPTILQRSTLYVNLEPCAHFGKTPPCSNLIIEKQIPQVVIGALDTYSEVNGKGIEKMQNAGIKVECGILENECRWLNRRFYTFHEKNRPFVLLKWAQSADGFMDKDRPNKEKDIFWITQAETQLITHQWRAEEMGILVGKKTVLTDNPSLTVREAAGDNPTRFVIDSQKQLSMEYSIFDDSAPTYRFSKTDSTKVSLNQRKVSEIELDELSILNILDEIKKLNINSILVEGGKQTLQAFIDSGLWDEARVLIGDVEIGKGLPAPQLSKLPTETKQLGKDEIGYCYNFL